MQNKQVSRSKVNVLSVRQESLPVESQLTTDEKLQVVTMVSMADYHYIYQECAFCLHKIEGEHQSV